MFFFVYKEGERERDGRATELWECKTSSQHRSRGVGTSTDKPLKKNWIIVSRICYTEKLNIFVSIE